MKLRTLPIALALAGLTGLAAGCKSVHESPNIAAARVETRPFGTTRDGDAATLYVLRNSHGVEAHVTDFGATLTSLRVPDRHGALADVVLGFDDVSGYESAENQYFGCTAGRVANRIARGRFELDGEVYELATNNEPNHLHGGERGFGQRMFRAQAADGARVTFSYLSPDGEEGYPGNLRSVVTYMLTEDGELVIDYLAECDAPTPVNLTHHSYFNLAGAGHPTVLDHVLEIDAERYTPTDDTLIPTGELATVAGTPLDFRRPTRIGDRIALVDATPALGYDHNYAVGERTTEADYASVLAAGPVCRLAEPESGRILEIYTNQPGLQLYSGNFLRGQVGKGGVAYPHRSAACLETQGFPNAVNEPRFPSTVLRPGERYRQLTVHRFFVE